ncbi:MAG TPA: DUF2027 domain-containing protein [Bacteroidales bacterium]|nr:DUF2027 domain-containing protein [Bacteroidales bacterium]
MLQAGDKVKFLNSRGGGVVTRVVDSRTVLVATEDGFEIPTLVSELLKMDPEDAGGRFFEESYAVNLPPKGPEAEKQQEKYGSLPESAIRNRKKEEVLLAFIPHDQKWLITGMLDIFLINNSSWDVLYSIFLEDDQNRLQGKDYGSVYAGTHLLIATIDREALPGWLSGEVQLLFHKDQPESVIPPFNAAFRIQGQKFFREGNYRETLADLGKGIVLKLFSTGDLNPPGEKAG